MGPNIISNVQMKKSPKSRARESPLFKILYADTVNVVLFCLLFKQK